jgi:hypothetical protein
MTANSVSVMTESDILIEAERIISTAQSQGMTLRLLGGTAIGFRCPSAKRSSVSRKYPDIDLVGFKRQSRQLRELFPKLGYEPNQMFNALRGGSRLMFFDLAKERRIDIFLDCFDMCHKIELKDRLTLEPLTIPLADLLATKLQIFKTNEKDFKDIIAMLLDHNVVDSDQPDDINGKRLAELCADDWGIYKTFTIVIDKTSKILDSFDLPPKDRENVKERLRRISEMIEREPRSLKWKMRAKVGEKKIWYMLPDDMAE